MPCYVVLVNWTNQGIRNVKHTIERTDSGGDIAKKHRLKLKQAYWTGEPMTWSPSSKPPTTKPCAPTSWRSALWATANHHAPSVRRGRNVGDTPEARLTRSTSENSVEAKFAREGVSESENDPHPQLDNQEEF
jgi:hypothetical protein